MEGSVFCRKMRYFLVLDGISWWMCYNLLSTEVWFLWIFIFLIYRVYFRYRFWTGFWRSKDFYSYYFFLKYIWAIFLLFSSFSPYILAIDSLHILMIWWLPKIYNYAISLALLYDSTLYPNNFKCSSSMALL